MGTVRQQMGTVKQQMGTKLLIDRQLKDYENVAYEKDHTNRG
jgi:hypothetical protein